MRDRVAIVTGGATGIGLAITEELVRLGAKAVIASRKLDRLVPAAKGLSEDYRAEVMPFECNVRQREGVEALFDATLDRFGKVDFLINNGGGQFRAAATDISDRGWAAVIDTNLNGTWYLCQTAAKKWMLDHGGKIVTIVADVERGFPGMVHTGAARAGVINMAKTLAIEWAHAKINVNCVAPGVILSTGMYNYPPGMAEASRNKIPLRRLGTCDEVAAAVVYLLSPAGDFVTGETIKIDGGASLWGESWPIPPADAEVIELPPWPEDRWPQHAVKKKGDER